MTSKGGDTSPKDAESEIDFMILAADNVEALRQAVRILLATVRDLSLLLSSVRSEVDSLRQDMTRLQGMLNESSESIDREVKNRSKDQWRLLRIGIVGVVIVVTLIAIEIALTWAAIRGN